MRSIFISGVHSGPNPSPGVGVARSLRLAYPAATLVAVDYSTASSGLHSDVFDDVWLQRPWSEIDFATYRAEVGAVVSGGALWLSGLDLETLWLSRMRGPTPGLLVPERRAFQRVAKPCFRAARERLPISIPPSVPADRPLQELHAFCRRAGWKVWVKGPQYEARRVENWNELTRAVDAMSATWGAGDLFLQEHVAGAEESVAFCAFAGRLLDCVAMRKRAQTPEGKTWAGQVEAVPPATRERLAALVADLRWTGGGELEFVRGADGLNLIDLNPRFPAWIHGATLAGRNLPAMLVEAAGWGCPQAAPVQGVAFTRVVVEIPTRAGLPLPAGEPASAEELGGGKHPSGMPALSRRMAARRGRRALADAGVLDATVAEDLAAADVDDGPTPRRVLLSATLAQRLDAAEHALRGTAGLARFAYSAKTDPHAGILGPAAARGWLLETISQGEIQAGLRAGFAPERLIYNGPVPLFPIPSATPLGAYFCDSLESLQALVDGATAPARVLGVRVRPPRVRSRFGIDLSAPAHFARLVELLSALPAECPLGVHFHVAGEGVGFRRWRDLFGAVLEWARAMEEESGRPLSVLDAGGGFTPAEWDGEVLPALAALEREAVAALPGLRALLLEPGKALVQGVMALSTRVCEVRRCVDGVVDVVVDTAISELPMAPSFPHPVAVRAPDGRWRTLGRGTGRLLGRTCMENDVLATDVELPEWVRSGTPLAILDAGAYDASMSFPFGLGCSHA